jgi:S1-C subfamily serine protease
MNRKLLKVLFLAPLLLAGLAQADQHAARPSAVLGINIAAGPGESGPVDGVTVFGVSPGGPADEAGLRAGDLLTAIGEQSLADDDSAGARERLLEFMIGVSPGEDVRLEFLRDGVAQTATIVAGSVERAMFPPGFPFSESLGQLGEDIDARVVQPLVRYWRYGGWLDGLELVSLTPDLGSYFGVAEGILVIRAPATPDLGLLDGDVILKIGARVPRDPGHALRILRSYEPGEPLEVTIRRQQRERVVELERPDPDSMPTQGRFWLAPRPAA